MWPWRRRRSRDFSQEIEAHILLDADRLVAEGMNPDDARTAALRAFGNVTSTEERFYESQRMMWLDDLQRDVRYALRMLRRSPGLTMVAVLTLAIGISANLTIFGFAKELLLSAPRGIADPDRVARVFTNRFSRTSQSNYEMFRDGNHAFVALAAYREESMSLRTGESPESLFGMSVSGNYFPALGVASAIGRTIVPPDDRTGSPGVVVLSDRFWRVRFRRNPSVLGQSMTINGRLHTIIGVAPSEFSGTMAPLVPDLWIPLVQSVRGATASVQIIGRLRPGVTIAGAQAELTTLASRLTQTPSDERLQPMVSVYAARAVAPEIALPAAIFASLLLAVVGLVLLLACVNIANLLLARSADRSREIDVRLALGASRHRLVRQLMTESLLLSVIGSAVAALVAVLAAHPLMAAVASLPLPAPVSVEFIVDWRLIAAAMGFAAITTLAFGLVPALQSSKPDVLPTLKEGASTAGPKRSRLRSRFMTIQIAMSALLLVVAGLLVRALMSAQTLDRGLVTDRVLTASVDLESAGYTAERGVAFYERLRDHLSQTTGINAASVVDIVPLTLSNRVNEIVKETGSEGLAVFQNSVSPGHFVTLGIPLVAGRDFDARDRTEATAVVIINELLARRLWPGESAIGKRLRQRNSAESFGPWLEVVGIARDSKYATVGEDPHPFMYQPLAQAYRPAANILVKSKGSARESLPGLRAALSLLDPNLAIFNVMTLDEATSISLLPVKLAATLTGALGVLALVLDAIGLYGVMSYLVRQRTREIGIRMALGSHSGAVVRLITGQSMRWMTIGLALGMSAAFGVATLMAGFLYGVPPTDAVAFGVPALLLTATAFVASYIPARRATKVDPMVALHCE